MGSKFSALSKKSMFSWIATMWGGCLKSDTVGISTKVQLCSQHLAVDVTSDGRKKKKKKRKPGEKMKQSSGAKEVILQSPRPVTFHPAAPITGEMSVLPYVGCRQGCSESGAAIGTVGGDSVEISKELGKHPVQDCLKTLLNPPILVSQTIDDDGTKEVSKGLENHNWSSQLQAVQAIETHSDLQKSVFGTVYDGDTEEVSKGLEVYEIKFESQPIQAVDTHSDLPEFLFGTVNDGDTEEVSKELANHEMNSEVLPVQAIDTHAGLPKHLSSSLFIADLDTSFASEASLYEMFSTVGSVLSVRIVEPKHESALGKAYVNYRSIEEAVLALKSFNYTILNGTPIRLSFFNLDATSRYNTKANIFIKNLEKSIDSEALHDTFSAFGVVLSCKVKKDDSGVSKGYGYIQFEEEESAQMAIKWVNGMLLNDMQVYVGSFIPRVERYKEFQAQDQQLHATAMTPVEDTPVPEERLAVLEDRLDKPVSAPLKKRKSGRSSRWRHRKQVNNTALGIPAVVASYAPPLRTWATTFRFSPLFYHPTRTGTGYFDVSRTQNC